jgi:hypothetical protein
MAKVRFLQVLSGSALVVFLGLVCPATAAVVSVFDDPIYVDTSGGPFAESDNVQASLSFLGHAVNPFVGITASDFATAIDASDALLFPELEKRLLGPDLSASAKSTLTDYVASGGSLIINGGSFGVGPSATEFLNTVFGFSLMSTSLPPDTSSNLNTIDAAGTAFAGGPANVPHNNGTYPLISSLPAGTLVIYVDPGSTAISVAIIPFSAGQIIFLGWDWFNAAPVGGADGGWLEILDRAVEVASTRCLVIDAIDDDFSVINDGTAVDFFVLANDECSDDTPISVVELPGDLQPDRGGSATIDGAKVDYTPAAGFVGFEEFTYTAQDAGLDGGDDPPAVDQDTATVVVDVLENLIPDAVDDVGTTLQDQDTIIDVLENDSLGNAPNEVAIETEPANGSVILQTDGIISYSPNSDFFGEDSFEYRLTDANGDSDVAAVTVGVFFVSGQVPIDIMPNSDGNDLNLRTGQGAGIDIAILSVGEFFEAPNEIDPLTLKFGPREGNIWGSPHVRDVDADGDDDLVVKFLIQQTGIPCGDTHAILIGRTFDFQSISGRDTINTFNCPRIRKRH